MLRLGALRRKVMLDGIQPGMTELKQNIITAQKF